MSTVKRLFLYIVTAVSLGIFASGCGTLLDLLFDFPGTSAKWRGYGQGQFSIGLALVIIGALWFVFWRIIRKATAGNAIEQGSGIRKLYLNIILIVSSILVVSNLSGFFGWVIGGTPYDQFPSSTLSAMLVGAGLWWYHNRIEQKEGQPSYVAKVLRRWYIYLLSAFGLVSLVLNLIYIINASVLYLLPESGATVQGGGIWHGVLAYHAAWVLSGGLAWWYFWFRQAKGDVDSILRQVYLYLVPVTGGVIAALTALSSMLYRLLILAFNGGEQSDFSFFGWTVPTALVCGGIWYYHRKLVEEESAHLTLNKQSPRRLYLYLMSFIGLGTVVAGIIYLIAVVLGLLFDSVTTATVFGGNWWSTQLSLTLSLLLAGVPVWLYFWRTILRITGEEGVAERSSRSRRIYVYTVLGLSLIAAISTLVIVVYQIINGILQSDFGSGFFSNVTWSVSILLTSVPVLVYHWRLLREDQELGAEKIARKKRVNVVAGADNKALVRSIEQSLGYGVRMLRYTGEAAGPFPALSDEELEQLASRISEADGEGVIIDLTGATMKILPYEDD